MSWDFQPGIHPDADQLSVFVEGVTTAREHERMLTHLAQCAECRKAVFLMQPHEEPQRAAATPVRGRMWRWLVPVGLPVAALACVLIAVSIHTPPHVRAPEVLQNARVSQPETRIPANTVAPSISSESVARSENPKNAVPREAAPPNPPRQEKQQLADGLDVSKSNSRQTAANLEPPQKLAAALPRVVEGGAIGGPIGAGRGVGSGGGIGSGAEPGALRMQPPHPAAAQNSLAGVRDLSPLAVERASGPDGALAGVSGRITDRSGAVVAGVMVTLHDASGNTRQTMTATDGSFHLTELPAGEYELTVTARGFKTSKQSIELKPSELATLQPVLDLGAASETVEVTGESATVQVQTESATVGGLITKKEVTNLPLNGRNVAQLIPLAPGITGIPGITTVTHGKQSLSLDSAGNLSLSRDGGKKWKKINPQWVGKAVRLELIPAYSGETPLTTKNKTGPVNKGAAFQLTTDVGAVWTSKDGVHWRQE